MLSAFCSAYFAGDAQTLRTYLTEPFEWSVDTYTGKAVQEDSLKLKGLAAAAGIAVGDSLELSVEFMAEGDDSLSYLTVTAVLQSNGWRVSFYGLEK